jgi:RimJ/RimL family protein N-acetyltransferase
MELIDEKVRLRPLRYADKERLAHLANNKNIWNNLRDMFPYPYTKEDAVKFLDSVKQQEPQVTFAIEYEFSFAGVLGLVLQSDVYCKSAEIGYWIGQPFWGKGITTSAVKLAVKYAFETLNLNRVYAGVFEGNEASKKVLEKCGFQLEGISRKAVYKNKRMLDEYRYGIVKSNNNSN